MRESSCLHYLLSVGPDKRDPDIFNKHFGALKYFNRWQSALCDLESYFYHTAETILAGFTFDCYTK